MDGFTVGDGYGLGTDSGYQDGPGDGGFVEDSHDGLGIVELERLR